MLGNVIDVGEKRSNRRPDCDCQLSVRNNFFFSFTQFAAEKLKTHFEFAFQSEFIDLGASTYPRFVRNVTCDGHSRCQHAPRRGLHCLPIHYDVSQIISVRSQMG